MNLSSIIPVPDRISTPAKLFLFSQVLNGFANGIFNVVFQLYLISLGFDSVAIGSISMMSAIGLALSSIPAGVLADRYGKGKIILSGLPIAVLALIMVLTSKSLEMFRLAFLLLGLNNGIGVVWGPLYSLLFDREDMDKAFGLLGSLGIFSNSIGNLMGFIPPILVDKYGLSLPSSYWTMMIISAGLWFTTMPLTVIIVRAVVEPKSKGGFRFNIRSKGVVAKFCFLRMIESFGFLVFFSLFPYYVNRKFGVESDALGALFFVTNFISAGAQAIAPRVSQRLGTLKTVVASISLCSPFYLMIPLAPNLAWLSVLYTLRRGFKSMADPLTGSLIMKLLYDDEKATANSIITMTNQGSSIVAPLLGGQIMRQISLDLPAFLGGGLFVLHATSFYFLLRNEKEIEPTLVEVKEPS